MEIWFYPKITTTNKTDIFVDQTSNVGLFYEKGNLSFEIDDYIINYTIPYIKKSHHIVAVYSVNNISLYVDGMIVGSKQVTSYPALTNTGSEFQIGPTANSSDSFIVDAPAIYRYGLKSDTVYSHYIYGQPMNIFQVATPEEGSIFTLSDQNLRKPFSYSYPFSKSLSNFVNEDIVYNEIDQSISIIPTSTSVSKTVEFTDFIIVPTNIGLAFSRIEWSGENGISVETSVDGTTYVSCVNGQNIPQYENGDFDETGNIYIKFTLSTSDASKYVPKLSYLNISFYPNMTLSADNFGDTIVFAEKEYFLGNKNYNILSRDYRNGLRCQVNSGFTLNTDTLIKTIEFFYTPETLGDSGLVSSLADTTYAASNYSWRNSGTISKTNVSAIYINGVDKTSETNVSNVFKVGELHHVVIVYTEYVSDDIKFNYSLYGAVDALYKNIAIYPSAFTSEIALNHYNLYIEKAISVVDGNSTAITVTEETPLVYNNDWIVLQST